jgi:transcriptional regulator with XRE-family HTH domain
MIVGFPSIDPQNKAIGHRVQIWRMARGVSLEALATKLGLDPGFLGRAEQGQCRLTASQLYAVTLQLSLPMRLLFEDGAPPNHRNGKLNRSAANDEA